MRDKSRHQRWHFVHRFAGEQEKECCSEAVDIREMVSLSRIHRLFGRHEVDCADDDSLLSDRRLPQRRLPDLYPEFALKPTIQNFDRSLRIN